MLGLMGRFMLVVCVSFLDITSPFPMSVRVFGIMQDRMVGVLDGDGC
jgi:hypothetical protein